MTQKKTKNVDPKLRKFVINCVHKYQNTFELERFDGKIAYIDEDGDIAASINVDLRYLNFTISVYRHVEELWKKGNKDRIDQILAHEVSHILTQHMMDLIESPYKNKEEAKDAWESLTETISRMAIKINNAKK